jgi:PIN domain nuclease of toxin-antitoxin system
MRVQLHIIYDNLAITLD